MPGVKGMHWGIRRYQNEDGSLTEAGREHYGVGESKKESSSDSESSKTSTSRYVNADGSKNFKKIKKEAADDAKEYARAKAYYGEGAGTRRKKIKNQISEKMKDPDYKKEFEAQLKAQNMEEHQKAANRERKMQDTKDKAARVGRGLKNLLLGGTSLSLTAIAIYSVIKNTGAGDMIASKAKSTMSTVMNTISNMRKSDYYKGYNWQSGKSSSAFADFMRNR